MSPSPNEATNAESSSSGKCPVDHKAGASSLWKVLGVQSLMKQEESLSPRDEELRKKNLPASLEEAAKHAQSPHPGQRLPLSQHRSVSSIPRGASDKEDAPHHQLHAEETSRWVYPSEQQVFNAMKRKGWEGVEEESIPSFLQIHNSVNERSWRLLQEWERSSLQDIQLVRFQGRPKDLSPKAWIWSRLLFQPEPFDRHDWYIDNGVQMEKRYVLDFYMNEDARSGLPRVDVDVRPALDTPQAFVERAQRLAMDMFPGITKELQRMKASSNQASGRS